MEVQVREEMKAIAPRKSKLEIVFEKEIVIDYDQPLLPVAPPRYIKNVSDDILKAKVKEKRTGKWLVNLGLVFAGKHIDHRVARSVIGEEGLNLAGVHETMALLPIIPDFPDEKFRFTALRDEMIDRGVEFVLTVHGTKKAAHAVMDFRDFLIDKNRLFVVEMSEPKKLD
ncbi:MAG: hypothetical protein WAW11_03960 [Patescibacteria group bacterium]